MKVNQIELKTKWIEKIKSNWKRNELKKNQIENEMNWKKHQIENEMKWKWNEISALPISTITIETSITMAEQYNN